MHENHGCLIFCKQRGLTREHIYFRGISNVIYASSSLPSKVLLNLFIFFSKQQCASMLKIAFEVNASVCDILIIVFASTYMVNICVHVWRFTCCFGVRVRFLINDSSFIETVILCCALVYFDNKLYVVYSHSFKASCHLACPHFLNSHFTWKHFVLWVRSALSLCVK